MQEKQRIQLLAGQLQSFLMITDNFVENLTEEDYDLLKQAENTLLNIKNIKESTATITMAFGIVQDTINEKYKIKTIDALIELFKVRKEYMRKLEEKIKLDKKNEENREDILKIFKYM